MISPATPAVSLLVPVYNVERYLEECLQSAKTQTLTDIEIICINDGSTDGSLAIINSFIESDPRFKLIDKENSGYGASMNKGLQAATGEYVGILESDDFLDSEALEVLYRAATEAKAEVTKSSFYFYWSTPEERNVYEPLIAKDMSGFCNPQEDTRIFYLKPTIWSALYQREFLNKHKIIFLETPGASYQDAGFNFKVWASATRVVFLREAFLHYRQDNEASSVNSPDKVYCVMDEYAEMQRFLDARPQKKARLQAVLARMKYDSFMWNYNRLNERFKLEFLQRASQELKEDVEQRRLDMKLFEPWAEADLRALLNSAETYSAYRLKYSKPGKINTLIRYLSLGGPKLVGKLVYYKVFKGA